MEKQVKSIKVHGKGCIGCKHYETNIMLSMVFYGEDDVHDMFLGQDTTEYLLSELKLRVEENKAGS